LIIVIVVVILVLLAGVVGMVLLRGGKEEEKPTGTGEGGSEVTDEALYNRVVDKENVYRR